MADIVGEAERLGQILVEAERARDGPADLRDFEAVGEPDPEMIAVGRDEDLGLVPQPAERDRMDDPVAVALEGVARAPVGALVFGVPAAAAPAGSAARRRAVVRAAAVVRCWCRARAPRGAADGLGSAGAGGRHCWSAPSISWPAALVQANAATFGAAELVDEGLRLRGAVERPDQQPVGGG